MTQLICSLIDFAIDLVAMILPDITLPEEVVNAINTGSGSVAEIFNNVNFIIPVPLIFKILILMITFRFGNVMLWALNWIIKRIFDVIP